MYRWIIRRFIIVPTEGTEPYSICEMVIAKKVSVNTEPHKCVVAPSGIAKSTMSGGKTEDLSSMMRTVDRTVSLKYRWMICGR